VTGEAIEATNGRIVLDMHPCQLRTFRTSTR